jgi:hypothetical protein
MGSEQNTFEERFPEYPVKMEMYLVHVYMLYTYTVRTIPEAEFMNVQFR